MKALCSLLLWLFAVPLWAGTGSARTDYVCSGDIRSENIFESGSAAVTKKQYRLIVNTDNNTVKRDPELAAGCLTRQIEICRCELSADAVRCLSMGINHGGQEVQADFTLDRRSQQMHVTGRLSDPQTGRLIETQGILTCEVQPASPY